ncbi:MAG: squalene/phytoene synthase family protein, partial [Methylovirgula sp.]
AHAGVAYALTGLLRGLPWQVAAGQTYVPRELYGAAEVRADRPALDAALAKLRALARQNLAALAADPTARAGAAAPVFLPAALCELYLRQMEKPGYDPLATPADVPQWRRQWRLWRAARRIG